jgi:hypothetical protein
LDLFFKGINLGLASKLNSLGLHPLQVDFFIFLEVLLIDLHPEITIEPFFLFILDRSVHEILSFRLRILHGMIFKEF